MDDDNDDCFQDEKNYSQTKAIMSKLDARLDKWYSQWGGKSEEVWTKYNGINERDDK